MNNCTYRTLRIYTHHETKKAKYLPDSEHDCFDRLYCSKFEQHLLHLSLRFQQTKPAVLMDMFPIIEYIRTKIKKNTNLFIIEYLQYNNKLCETEIQDKKKMK